MGSFFKFQIPVKSIPYCRTPGFLWGKITYLPLTFLERRNNVVIDNCLGKHVLHTKLCQKPFYLQLIDRGQAIEQVIIKRVQILHQLRDLSLGWKKNDL